MPINEAKLNGKAVERPASQSTPKAEVLRLLNISEKDFNGHLWAIGKTPKEEYTQAEIDAVKDFLPASDAPKTAESATSATPQPQATEAEKDASRALDLAVQSKQKGVQDAANRGALQAIEEVKAEFTTYAKVYADGMQAATDAKRVIREGLNQIAEAPVVEVNFSNFFNLSNATAPHALEGER